MVKLNKLTQEQEKKAGEFMKKYKFTISILCISASISTFGGAALADADCGCPNTPILADGYDIKPTTIHHTYGRPSNPVHETIQYEVSYRYELITKCMSQAWCTGNYVRNCVVRKITTEIAVSNLFGRTERELSRQWYNVRCQDGTKRPRQRTIDTLMNDRDSVEDPIESVLGL